MKRFWKDVTIAPSGGSDWTIHLDDRPVKTPAGNPLVLPTRALVGTIAEEWTAQDQDIDPRTMPLTGLANAALDGVLPDLTAYAQGDVLCYRAEEPPALVARQAERWDPLLSWARTRYDIDFEVVQGIVHRPQPPATIARLAQALAGCDPFRLAALSPLVTIGGSLVTALAVLEGRIDAETAFADTHLDELWQVEHWGEDVLATAARNAHRSDFLAAAHFLALLNH